MTLDPGAKTCRPPRRIDEESPVERRAGSTFVESDKHSVAQITIGSAKFDLRTRGWRNLRLKEGVVNILANVVVLADPIRVCMKLPDAIGEAIVNAGQHQIVRFGCVIAEQTVPDESNLISREQPGEFVKTESADAAVEERKAVISQPRLNRADIERLKQLRLQ